MKGFKADIRQQSGHRAPAQSDIGEVIPGKAENLQELAEIEELLENPEKLRLVVSTIYMLLRKND